MPNPLRAYREKKKLSQEALADFLGVSRGLVSLIETGERDITPENADAWAGKLGVPRESLCPLFRERVA